MGESTRTDGAAGPPIDSVDSDRKINAASRTVGWIILGLLATLLVDALFEGWIQQLFGDTVPGPKGEPTVVPPGWPKDVKNTLYLLLLGATVIKVAIDRSWREFRTKAELALAVVGLVMIIAGLFGGSDVVLISEAGFVYFRGVIVFFAWRALRPTWRQVRPVFYVVGAIAALNAVIAIVESLVGYPSYKWFGWTELTWAKLSRAHALMNHPNHLGHFLMLVLLGLLAWFTTKEVVRKRWWVVFAVGAFALSTTQSRESIIGVVLGAAVMWWIRRRPLRPILIAALVVVLCYGLQLAVSAENRATLAGRLNGVFTALNLPAGQEKEGACTEGSTCAEVDRIGRREIRALFWQQGVTLLSSTPALGFGVGQFGGIVAYENDPHWNDTLTSAELDTKHPDFELYGGKPDQVDSFWLHLLMETGILGFAAYFTWLYFLARPMIAVRERGPWWGNRAPRGPPPEISMFALWGPAALAGSIVIALLSPAMEDQLYPALLFTVLGLGWVAIRRGDLAGCNAGESIRKDAN